MLTKQEIINALNQVDRDLRPFAIFANPIYKEQLKEFESEYKIELFPHIPTDTIYLVDRDNYELTVTQSKLLLDGIVGGFKNDR